MLLIIFFRLLIVFTTIGIVFRNMGRGEFSTLLQLIFSSIINASTALVLQLQDKNVDKPLRLSTFYIFSIHNYEILKSTSHICFTEHDKRTFLHDVLIEMCTPQPAQK